MVERREQLYGLQLAFAASICSCEQVHRPGPKQKLTLEFSVHSSVEPRSQGIISA
jgi:hypothetical protein